MASADAAARTLARVERVCGQRLDALELRLTLAEELRAAVTFDAYAWVLTDPETRVGSVPLADVPPALVRSLPTLVRLKYLTTVNRWTTLSGAPVATLLAATDGDPGRSLLWRELLGPAGVHDIASVVFADRYGCWAFLEMWRTDPSEFTIEEAKILATFVPPVTTALRRAQAATFEIDGRAPAVGPVVLVLTPTLEVRAQTPRTQELLRVLVPPDGDTPPIPASAYNVAAQLLAVEAGVDAGPPTARMHLAGGAWVTLRADRLGGSEPISEQDIAVTIETTPPRSRAVVFGRAYGLGHREQEVLDHLLAGRDTREVARLLGLSEHTVATHVKSIHAKTSVTSRATLQSRALGA